MNQKINFAIRTDPGSVLQSRIVLFLIGSLWFFIVNASSNANAQGSFVPPPTNSNYAQWSPPSSQPQNVNQAVNEQSQFGVSNSVGFPASPVAFDPGVRTAKLEVPSPQPGLNENSVESTIDSSVAMLSNLKDATSEKLSGLAATFAQDGGWAKKIKSAFGSSETSRMLGSLTLVLGIYFAFVWVMRKINPAGNAGLPAEVIEVLGQVPFGPKRSLQLVRLGSKLLLLMNSPEGTQPIGEITDANEVEYLASICPGKKRTKSNGASALHRVATRIANANPTQVASPAPTPASSPSTATASHGNLANILRTLEQASKRNGAVFEA